MTDAEQWFRNYDPKGKIRDIVKATNCRLTYNDSISYELIEATNSDILQAMKKQMSAQIGSMIMGKTKFTMRDDPNSLRKVLTGSVYVFTEAEIMKLVEDIQDAG